MFQTKWLNFCDFIYAVLPKTFMGQCSKKNKWEESALEASRCGGA
jgi:hypothetical protein